MKTERFCLGIIAVVLCSLIVGCNNEAGGRIQQSDFKFYPKLGDTLVFKGDIVYHCVHLGQMFDTVYTDTLRICRPTEDTFYAFWGDVSYKLFDWGVDDDKDEYPDIFYKVMHGRYKIQNGISYIEADENSEQKSYTTFLFSKDSLIWIDSCYTHSGEISRSEKHEFKGKLMTKQLD